MRKQTPRWRMAASCLRDCHRKWQQFREERAGGILVVFAILLPAMVGLTGLGVEVGYWYVAKRDLQTEADAGAIGGTWEKAFGRTSSITSSATNEAVRNGFPNTPPTTSIAVHSPPTSGGYVGDTKAVQVILTRAYSPMFASLFLSGDMEVAARATGTVFVSGNACVLGLNGTASQAVNNTGSLTLSAPHCAIASNSNASNSINFGGNSTVTVDSIWAAGGITSTATLNAANGTHTNMWPLTDPYSNLPYTAPNGCSHNNMPPINSSTSLSPGTYCGGIQINAGAVVDLAPGTYWMKGGDLVVNGSATLHCTTCSPGGLGVTFIFTTPANGNTSQIGTVTINGNATVVLNAPSSGTYQGILFFQNPNAPTDNNHRAQLNGGSNTVLNGAIYYPHNNVDYSGNTGLAADCTLIVANTVTFTGNAGLNVDGCEGQGVTTVVTEKVALVE